MQAVDNRHRFPATFLSLARDPYNAFSNMAGALTTAYAASDGPVTMRTELTLIRAVHRVAFDFFVHDLFGVFFTSPASLAVGMVCVAGGRSH